MEVRAEVVSSASAALDLRGSKLMPGRDACELVEVHRHSAPISLRLYL